MRQRIQVKRSNPAQIKAQPQIRPQSSEQVGSPAAPQLRISNRLLSTLRTYLPGAWIDPRNNELIALYRLRYRMAMEEEKYDTAMIFLNKILELDPLNLEAKFCKGEIYHRCLRDYSSAIEQYNKVIRLSAGNETAIETRARAGMAEIMEMLS
jgi:tetratricopeptide (TPR) repeat protein